MKLNILKTLNIELAEELCTAASEKEVRHANDSFGGDCYNCNCDCRYTNTYENDDYNARN